MYYVSNVVIPTNFFTHKIKMEKLNQLLADRINSIEQKGYEIVTVIPLNIASYAFNYQIVYKDSGTKESTIVEGEFKEAIESKEEVKSTPKEAEPVQEEISYDDYEVIDTSVDTITDDDFDYDSSIDIGDKVVVIDDTICGDYIIKKYSIGVVKDIRITFGGKEYLVEFDEQHEVALKRHDIVLNKH